MENNNEKIFLTSEGYQKIKNEYEELINVKRKQVAQKIQAAREEGDITDSAMYDSARQEQAFVEGRIQELEDMLKKVEVVSSVENSNGEACLGCKVKVHIEGNEAEFHLVSAPEADPSTMKISIDSPLGKAIMGKKVGDEVEFEAPVGTIKYKILSIS